MKIKRFQIYTLLLLALSSRLAAQGASSVEINVSARIQDYIEMVTLADIDVGTIVPSEEILRLDPRTNSGAGIIMIQGQKDKSVLVNYSKVVEMVHSNSNSVLPVTYEVSGSVENQPSTSVLFTTNPESIELNEKGEYYLFIGCSFNLNLVKPGQYDGDFVIEVDYN